MWVHANKSVFFCVCVGFVYLEKRVWTVLAHNITAPVKVQGSSLQKPHIMMFNYSASAKQLHAIITGSEQCQQEVVYNCRNSRLFNTKGKIICLKRFFFSEGH